jgi:hypothetical protein
MPTDGGGDARRLSLELHVRNAAQAELLASMLVFCPCTDSPAGRWKPLRIAAMVYTWDRLRSPR